MYRFRAEASFGDRMDAQAAKRGMNRSEWMRRALARVLDEAERLDQPAAPLLHDLPDFDA